MKKSSIVYKFDNFAEIVDFLKNNPDGTRKVKYRDEGVLNYTDFDNPMQNYFYLDEYPWNSKDKSPVVDFRDHDYFDKETGEPNNEAFARDYDLNDFCGIEEIKDGRDEKVYVLMVQDHENQFSTEYTVLLFHSEEKALDAIRNDLRDRNHFDTNEPYCTEEELADCQKEVIDSILKCGWWNDDEVMYDLFEIDEYED